MCFLNEIIPLLLSVTENAVFGILILDLQKHVIYKNTEATRLLKHEKDKLNLILDSNPIHECRGKYIKIERKEILGYTVYYIQDVTRIEKNRRKLYYYANYDSLTGLKNRRAILSNLRNIKTECYVAMIDLDNFKRINDSYGHPIGDLILSRFGEMIKSIPSLIGGRIGGEEFLVILKTSDKSEALKILKNLLVASNKTLLEYGGIRFSVGVCRYNSKDSAEVLKRLDKILYSAKRNGKNQICDSNL